MNIRTELFRDKLPNVAPYCTIEATGWTGSQSGEVLATGDGTTVDFSGKVDLPPVNPLNSFTLHYTIGGTAYSVQADANGNFSDANVTGSVAQDGTWNATFNTAPDNGADITADYDYGIAPANLENALSLNKDEYAELGWTSTTGATSFGKISINFPDEKGTYFVCGICGGAVFSGSGTYVKFYFLYNFSTNFINGNYFNVGGTTDWATTSAYATDGELALEPVFWAGMQNKFVSLSFYTNGASEVKAGLLKIAVFKVD